jgi:hypothetical protein
MRRIVLLTVFELSACAVATSPGYMGPNIAPTAVTKSRQQYRGFSVEPPTGVGWYVNISEQTPLRATYRLTLKPVTHTFIAGVGLVQLDKSVPLQEALIPHAADNPERNQVLEETHELDTSRKIQCIRYSIRLLDKGAPNSGGAALYLIDRGFVCAHPTMPGMAVRASFSERGTESELDPNLWGTFDVFLQSVHIESAPGVPVA